MSNELLISIAKAALTKLIGEGDWYKPYERPRWAKIPDPLPNLAVGDVVYIYDSDEEEIKECRVVTVDDGIGYVASFHRHFGPTLEPVSEDFYARTAKEAAELGREEIESDMAYARKNITRMEKVWAVLESQE